MKFETLIHALEYYADKHPEKLLLADVEREMRYAEFFNAVKGFVAFLNRCGVVPGDIVAVQNTQTAAFAVAAFGTQARGCICVPIDGDASQARIEQILLQTGARFAAVKQDLNCGVPYIRSDKVIFEANEQGSCDLVKIDPDQISEILFTTGTTGVSKGVMHTYRSEYACAENQIHSLCATPDDVWMIPMPLSHAMGLRKLHGAILSGGTVVLTNGVIFAGALFDAMARYHVTILSLVPAYLAILVRMWEKELARFDLQLRCVRLGSGAASKHDLERLSEILPHVTVCICYGSSEASDCAYYRYQGYSDKIGCVGSVNKNARIRLLNEDGGEITAPDILGRIELSGANLMCGYFGEEELTRSVLNNGRLKSGDIGYFGKDGLLYLVGRADEVINSGGYKIAPGEVEEATCKINGVADCACIAAPDTILGEIPMLAVVMQSGHSFSAEKIYQALSEQLEKHLLPRVIVKTENIPRTANGKPQRAMLKKRLFPEE